MAGREFSRREFLRAVGAWTMTPYLDKAVELLPLGVLAFGAYLVPGPNGEKVGEWASIIGTKGYSYLVETGKGTKEVPLANLKILEGWPFACVQLPYFGLRCDAHWMTEWVPRLGGSMVRINIPVEQIGTEAEIELGMRNAAAMGLRPVAVFNPTKLPDEGYLRSRVKRFWEVYPYAVLEAGNEPDNHVWEMWQGRDFVTFAKFMRIVYDESRQCGHGDGVVLGALVDIANQPKLFSALRVEGVDPNWFLGIGLHVYQSRGAVTTRMMAMKNYMKQAGVVGDKIWVTELGVNYKEKRSLTGMVDEAVRLKAAAVLIHELPVWNASDGVWGLVDPYLETSTPTVFDIAAWSRKRAASR